ncbi:DUF6456 domain-containing protein [Aminobacter sp. HY435]|uniref:DUF6456 domain-containing protein n=1 Tax=Aminobacter sp. HY435 TaxID=2970917 RepID=UPI0022B97FFC|nr:DUF6456 domain-containing protein [Aminobacter sp. HY435]
MAGDEKERARALRLLAKGGADVSPAAVAGKLVLANDRGERVAVGADLVAAIAKEGLVARCGAKLQLTATGHAKVRRDSGQDDPFQAQHREIGAIVIDLEQGMHVASVNLSESPLGQLARRKTKAGATYLSAREFNAGERLRSDYARGQIMPRLGANWVASIASGKRGGGSGGAVELTDAALAARQRVDNAIDAVGPELAGVLIDVCCFLKGLELVEAERGWPMRSAKVVLKSALGVLARHYEPAGGPKTARRFVHWGADDYRPKLG